MQLLVTAGSPDTGKTTFFREAGRCEKAWIADPGPCFIFSLARSLLLKVECNHEPARNDGASKKKPAPCHVEPHSAGVWPLAFEGWPLGGGAGDYLAIETDTTRGGYGCKPQLHGLQVPRYGGVQVEACSPVQTESAWSSVLGFNEATRSTGANPIVSFEPRLQPSLLKEFALFRHGPFHKACLLSHHHSVSIGFLNLFFVKILEVSIAMLRFVKTAFRCRTCRRLLSKC